MIKEKCALEKSTYTSIEKQKKQKTSNLLTV